MQLSSPFCLLFYVLDPYKAKVQPWSGCLVLMDVLIIILFIWLASSLEMTYPWFLNKRSAIVNVFVNHTVHSFHQRSLQIDVAFLARHQTRPECYLPFPSLCVSSLPMEESILALFASNVEQLDKAKTTSVFGLQ